MAISEAYSGTATIGSTEWSLTTNTSGPDAVATDDGMYQLYLDLSALAAGDVFELCEYEKVVSGGAQLKTWSSRFSGVQATQPKLPAGIFMHGFDWTLKKISGTDRSITWSIRKVA